MITCQQAEHLPAIPYSFATEQSVGSRTLTEVVCLALYGSALKPGCEHGSLNDALKPLCLEGRTLWRNPNGPVWLVPHLKLITDRKSWPFRPDTEDENEKITLDAFRAAERWLTRSRRMGFVYGLPAALAEKVLSLANMNERDAIRAAMEEADRIDRAEAAINAKSAEFYKLLSHAVVTQRISLKAIATDPRTNAWLPRTRGEPPHQTIPRDYFELPMDHCLFANYLEANRFDSEAEMLRSVFDRIEQANDASLVKWADVKITHDHASWLLSSFRNLEREPVTVVKVDRPRARGGRRKGDGSYAACDQPLLAEMRELIKQRKAASPEAASHLVAMKAIGSGSPESKAERLAKRFRAAQKCDRNNSD